MLLTYKLSKNFTFDQTSVDQSGDAKVLRGSEKKKPNAEGVEVRPACQ